MKELDNAEELEDCTRVVSHLAEVGSKAFQSLDALRIRVRRSHRCHAASKLDQASIYF